MQTTLNLTSVYDVIDYINTHAKNAVERGTWWEKAVVFYLRHDPEMRQIMGDVKLWADAPTNDGHDTGIDVVCEYNGTASQVVMRYWAVQCKNFDPNHKMDYKELSTFWAKAEADPRYAGYAVVSASDFSKNAIAHGERAHDRGRAIAPRLGRSGQIGPCVEGSAQLRGLHRVLGPRHRQDSRGV